MRVNLTLCDLCDLCVCILSDGGSMRIAVCVAAATLTTITLVGQTQPLKYPQTRKDATVDTYFGTKVADPYQWMEDLNSPELKKWIEEENAITFKYLDG